MKVINNNPKLVCVYPVDIEGETKNIIIKPGINEILDFEWEEIKHLARPRLNTKEFEIEYSNEIYDTELRDIPEPENEEEPPKKKRGKRKKK